MSVHSVSPPIPPSHSYAYWSGALAAVLATLLDNPTDEVHRARARRLLHDFDDECRAREAAIGEIAPQSIRADLEEFVSTPERLLRAVYDGQDVP